MRKEHSIKFNVSAYTARLIGRENVSKIEGAVLELIKNSYDADAKFACIYYDDICKQVFIIDNGTGMKENIIMEHWMTIGNSSKKEIFISKAGRVQTGEKGIGRFALDRIADQCNMLTVSDASTFEWSVNWKDFDDAVNISDVEARLYYEETDIVQFISFYGINNNLFSRFLKKIFKEKKQGTVFRLIGLRDNWNEALINNLRNHLSNLLPPDAVKDFKLYIFDNETTEEKAIIESNNIESFDYKISFKVYSIIDRYKINIKITRNEFDFGEEEEKILKEAGFDENDKDYFHGKVIEIEHWYDEVIDQNIIGEYEGVMYFNKITYNKDDKKIYFYRDITGRRNLTSQFGGIKIYRDKFRVRPYGEKGISDLDWLELSARRNRQPAGISHQTGRWRVGADQIIGTINISRNNKNLEDDANRNGIQDGEGFQQLKKVLLFVIDTFERDRQYVGRKLYEKSKNDDIVLQQIEEIKRKAKIEAEQKKDEEINDNKSKKEEIKRDNKGEKEVNIEINQKIGITAKVAMDVIDSVTATKDKEIQDLKDEIKMLQTLATVGIITNMFMHEIRALTNNIGMELSSAYDSLVYDKDLNEALLNVKRGIEYKKNFTSWYGVTIDAIKKDKRKRKNNEIKKLLEDFIGTWDNILNKKSIKIKLICDCEIMFRCFTFDIENIFSNLISNSVHSFEREADKKLNKKEIYIHVHQDVTKKIIIDYSDTGWGLPIKYKHNPQLILEAFETDKQNRLLEDEGTGMGMWIINKTVLEYNGEIDLSKNKSEEIGFYIAIKLGGNSYV